jgi:hypothetical protein
MSKAKTMSKSKANTTKSKTASYAHSKAEHDKISKQIKDLSVQVTKLSKQMDKVCTCNGMGCGPKKMTKSKAAKRKEG